MINVPFGADGAAPVTWWGGRGSLVPFCLGMTNNNNPPGVVVVGGGQNRKFSVPDKSSSQMVSHTPEEIMEHEVDLAVPCESSDLFGLFISCISLLGRLIDDCLQKSAAFVGKGLEKWARARPGGQGLHCSGSPSTHVPPSLGPWTKKKEKWAERETGQRERRCEGTKHTLGWLAVAVLAARPENSSLV